ncbi:MAG: DNA polymerase-4 [Pseudohongiellaceae bacterium]|jgi:DNA polymerase-4
MDAFFASVEQRDDPSMRGRPVIVGGLGARGVVAAASYEARRFGVHSAQPTAEARRLCPGGYFVPPRMSRYSAASRLVREVFESFTDLVEPLSLDEAFLDVTGSLRLFGDGRDIAERLREEVFAATELKVSVGVASSKYVAKVASDVDKPDGLTIVPPGGEAEFLAPLPIRRLWGAGKVLGRRLADQGWTTIGDLQAQTIEQLVMALGERSGMHFFDLCRGHDQRPVQPSSEARSVSRETTFGEDVSDDNLLHAVLLDHAEDVGRRLRRQGLVGRTVRLKLRYPPFETLSRQTRLHSPTSDDAAIYQQGRQLLAAVRSTGRPVRLIGLGMTDLCSADVPVQQELFAALNPAPADKVNKTLDAIRERFGGSAASRLGGRPRKPNDTTEELP